MRFIHGLRNSFGPWRQDLYLGAHGCSSQRRSSDDFSASFLLTQLPRISTTFSPGVYLLSAALVFPLQGPPSLLRLHGDLAALPRDDVIAGHWSPQIPACWAGAAVPTAKERRTLEPDPENRRDPGERGCSGISR